MQKKILQTLPWPDPPKQKSYGTAIFIIKTSFHIINHERMLQICFWGIKRKDKKFRFLISKKSQDWTCETAGINDRKFKTSIRSLIDVAFDSSPVWGYSWIEEADEKRIKTFLGISQESMNHYLPELTQWQDKILRNREIEKEKREAEIDEQLLAGCPEEIPEGLITYIRDVVLKEDYVLLYRRSRGTYKVTCYVCGNTYIALETKPSHHYMTHCEICGAKVIALSDRSSHKLVDFVSNIAFAQKGTDGTVWIRQFHLARDRQAKYDDIRSLLIEFGRYRIEENKVRYWKNEGKYGFHCERFVFDKYYKSKLGYVYDGGYYFWIESADAFEGTRLQYCDLQGYLDRRQQGNTNPLLYIIEFARFECIEYLEKKGYTELVDAKLDGAFCKEDYKLINFRSRSKKELFSADPHVMALFKPQEISLVMLRLISKYSTLMQTGYTPNDVVALVKLGENPDRIQWLLEYITPQKLYRYIGSQACEAHRSVGSCVNMYIDYIRSAIAMRYDLTRKDILMPRDLIDAHDTVTKLHAAQKTGILSNSILDVAKKMDKYSYSDKQLLIRPVLDHYELIDEGIKLHHCVGTYAQRISEGKTTIFVIRRKSKPEEPFCTLELNPDTLQVIQCRGDHNSKPPQEVEKFVEKWQVKKLRKSSVTQIAV